MGRPVTFVTSGAPPAVYSAEGAPPVTHVASGAPPVVLVADGAPPVDVSNLPATLFIGGGKGFWLDPSPPHTFQDAAGTTPAGASDPVGLVQDRSGNSNDADQPDDNNDRPALAAATTQGGGVLTFDGTDDRILIDLAAGQRSDNMTYMIAVKTTDTQAMLFAGAGGVTAPFIMAIHDGNTNDPHINAGSPVYLVDGVALSSPTRDDLHAAVADGDWHIVEMQSLDLTDSEWASCQISGWRHADDNTAWILDGSIGDAVLFDMDTATTAARDAAREYLAHRYGVAL